MKPSGSPPAVRGALVAMICLSVTGLAAGWSPADWIADTPLVRALARPASWSGAGGSPSPQTPTVTAAMTGAIVNDLDADGKADPGDTIRYTAVISAAGADASGVHFADTPDANTTLVGGSIVISPLAAGETYSSVGNMTLTSSAIAASCGVNPLRSVTCNDALNGGTLTGFGATEGTAAAVTVNGSNTVTTGNSGTVTLNTDGTFVYNPAAGFEGIDTFWYTLSNAAATDHASVTITVGNGNGMVWFVGNGGTGTGRQANPISLQGFRLVNTGTLTNPASGDTIFLFEGAHALTATVTLLSAQKLIGQDTTATLADLGAPAPLPGNVYPVVNNPTGTAVSVTSSAAALTLGSNNTLAGFSIGTSTTAVLANSSVGSLRVREVVVNTNGSGIVMTAGGTVVNDPTFTGFTSVTTTGGLFGVNLSGIAGTLALGTGGLSGATGFTVVTANSTANVTYAGTVNATSGQGLVFNNADGTYNFNGIVTLSGSARITIQTDSSGTFNFAGGSTITSPSAAAFTVSGGAPTVDYNGTITQNTTQRAVNITNTTGGSITFDGGVTSGGTSTGISITNAAGTIVTFTGGVALNTGGNAAFTAANSGTVTVTGGGNTLTTTTGTALTVTNTTIGAGGLWFHSISSNGALNGIVLTNTGAGGLAVTGAGTAGTGGTIQNSTQRGARFVNANNISLSWMNFTGNGTANIASAVLCGDALAGTNDNCAAGIDLQTVSGVSLTGVHVSGGAQIGINGKNVTGLTLTGVEVNNAGNEAKEDGIQIHNLFGVGTWAGLNAHDNAAAQVEIQNAGSTPVNLTMTSPQLTAAGFQSSVTGAQGLLFSGSGSADMTLSVTNATFARSFAAAFQADVTGSATATVVLDGGTMSDVGSFLKIGNTSSGNLTYSMTGYTAWVDPANTSAIPIEAIKGSGTGTLTGVISSNTFGDSGLTGSAGPCSSCPTMRVANSGTGATQNLLVSGNTMYHSRHGFIWVTSGELFPDADTGNMNVHIVDNAIGAADEPAANDIAIDVVSGGSVVDTSSTCARIGTNTIGGSYATLANGGAIRVRNNAEDSQFRLPGYVGGGSDTTAVAAFLSGSNGGADATATVNGNTFGGGGDCHSLVARNDVSPPAGRHAMGNGDGLHAAPGDRVVRAERGRWRTVNDLTARVVSSPFRAMASAGNRRAWLETTAGRLRARMPSMARMREAIESAGLLVRAAARSALPAALEASPQPPAVDVVLGTLPAGKTITVVFDVTVNTPPVAQYSTQGTVSGTNFSDVPTGTVTTPGDRFNTATVLASSLNPASQGESITFTATVTAVGALTPDGTLQFKDGAGNLGTAQTCAGSGSTCSAQFTTGALATGTRSITAEYSGGAHHDASTSNTVAQVNNACIAAPIVVTANQDSGAGSLRQAILDACPGNTITFSGVVSPIGLTGGQLTIDKSLTITGPGANLLTVGRISGTGRIFSVNPGVTATIEALTIANGQLGGSDCGAGIYNDRGTLTVRRATLSGHVAASGGGICSNADGAAASLTLADSTVSGNTAGFGGGIFTQGITGGTSTISIVNSTISGNTAVGDGGGLYTSGATNTSVGAAIANTTITGNRGDNAGGGIYVLMGTLTLGNTVVAGNFVGPGPGTTAGDVFGALAVASASNMIGVDTGMTGVTHGTNGNQVGMSGSPIDPRLGPLANHGGSTPTHALLAGSPALDAGDNALAVGVTDQRGAGFARIRDAADAGTVQTVDIGSFEADPSVEDIANKTTAEDTPLTFTFGVGDGATAFDSIAATSSNTTLLPGANAVVGPDTASTRTLTLAPIANQSGMTTITVTATKTIGGTPVTMADTFELSVGPVNDPPAVTAIANQTMAAGTSALVPFTVGDTETAATALSVTAASSNQAVVPDASLVVSSGGASRTLTLTANTIGTATITVTVSDGSLPASTSFVVTAHAVNHSGDFNGDGAADLAVYRPSTGQWFVRNQSALQFGDPGDVPVSGDYNGDGSEDIAVFRPSTSQWFVRNQFTAQWGSRGDVPAPGDFNGDGATDVAVYRPSTGDWLVRNQFSVNLGGPGYVPVVGDYNGDGIDDVAVFQRSTATWCVRNQPAVQFGSPGDRPVPADYDGNGSTDIAVYRPSTGQWLVRNHSTVQFGDPGDVPVPRDFDGNGTIDVAIYRPSTRQWFVKDQFVVQFGDGRDMPVPLMPGIPLAIGGDYDGDGVTDIAVHRPATNQWFVRNQLALAFGDPGDVPIPADYNGDRRMDVAVYRPSTGHWLVRNQPTVQWGDPGDKPVPADYNGDGLMDAAVFRPSTWQWFVRNQFAVSFGEPNDIPVPGDYNGDGAADLAVYRPATGQWLVRNQLTVSFGDPGDIPVPADYNGDGKMDVAVYRPSTGAWYVRNQFTVMFGDGSDVPVPGDYNGDGVTDVAVYRPSTGTWYVRNVLTVQFGDATYVPMVTVGPRR